MEAEASKSPLVTNHTCIVVPPRPEALGEGKDLEGRTKKPEDFKPLKDFEKNGEDKIAHEIDRREETPEGGPRQEGPPDGGWGWVVLLSAFAVMVLTTPMGPCFSLVYSPHLKSLNATSLTTSSIFNTFSFVWNILGPFVGPLTSECGHQRVAIIGALLCSLSFVVSAFSSPAWLLFVSFSLLGGVGAGLVVGASVLILPLYFSRRLGFANGLFMAGNSVGMFMAPQLIKHLQDVYQFQTTTIILGIILLIGCAAGATYRTPEWRKVRRNAVSDKVPEDTDPQRKETTPDSIKLLKNPENVASEVPKQRRSFLTRVFLSTIRTLVILKSFRALIICLTNTFVMSGYLNFLLLVSLAVNDNVNGDQRAHVESWCVSVAGICSLLTRVIMSAMSDRSWFHLRGCYMAGILVIVISSLAFSFVSSFLWMAVAMGFWGCGIGAFMGLYNVVMIRYMGVEKMPSMYGASSLLIGLGFITLGPLFGFIRDKSCSYQVTIWVLISTEVLCLLFWLFMPSPSPRGVLKKAKQEDNGI